MALVDKLGQFANKAGKVAGDTLDYSKNKGKIILEKGKVKDGKEALGDYVYTTLAVGEELDMTKINELCDEITIHLDNIRAYEEELKSAKSDDAKEDEE